MKKAAIFLGAALLSAVPAFGQNADPVSGFCDPGGVQAQMNGAESANYLHGGITSCTVRVYPTRRQTLAAIYRIPGGTPFSNPFTANSASSAGPGHYTFWASMNQGNDISLSGGVLPNIYPQAVAKTGVHPGLSRSAVPALDLNSVRTTQLNRGYTVNGDGVDDTSALLQSQIDLCPSGATCTYRLSNVVLANTVMIPSTSQFRFTCAAGPGTSNLLTSGGCVRITASAGFERTGGSPSQSIAFKWAFSGMRIIKSTAGPAIWDNLTFCSCGNEGLDVNGSTFVLSNGAYGIQTIGADSNNFIGNTFTMSVLVSAAGSAPAGSTSLTVASGAGIIEGMTVTGSGIASGTTVSAISGDTVTLSLATTAALNATTASFGTNCTSCYAIVPDMAVGNYGSQTTNVVGNFFYLGNVIGYPNISSTACPYGWQGWTFTGNQMWSSQFSIQCGNTINVQNNQIVGGKVTIDSLYEVNFSGNYLDGPGAPSSPYNGQLVVTNGYHNTVSVMIAGNFFQMNGQSNIGGVLFLNAGNGYQTRQVTLSGNQYQGTSDSATNPCLGIILNDPGVVGLHLSDENFLQVYAALDFIQPPIYSNIEKFNALSTQYYALNAAGAYNATGHNILDSIYKVYYDVHMNSYLPAAPSGTVALATSQLTFGTMMSTNPTISISPVSSDPCTSGWSIGFGPPWTSTNPYTYSNLVNLALNVAASTPAGYGSCAATVTIDGSHNPARLP